MKLKRRRKIKFYDPDNPRVFGGIWMDISILSNAQLTITQSVILTAIDFSWDVNGEYAGYFSEPNSYLSKNLGTPENIIEKEIRVLAKKGFIKIVGFDKDARIIDLTPKAYQAMTR